ncbi:hypothetical protein GCM10020331_012270 [Ectobacillus funiculus]
MILMVKKDSTNRRSYPFFKDGIKGIVEKVNQNSVIVNVTENKTELKFEGNRTVVAHKKNYKVIDYA